MVNNAWDTQSALRYIVGLIYSPIRREPRADLAGGGEERGRRLSLSHDGLSRTNLPALYIQEKKKKDLEGEKQASKQTSKQNSLESSLPKRDDTENRFVNSVLPSCNPAETAINKCRQQVGLTTTTASRHGNEL